jgi:hypothetical protein
MGKPMYAALCSLRYNHIIARRLTFKFSSANIQAKIKYLAEKLLSTLRITGDDS